MVHRNLVNAGLQVWVRGLRTGSGKIRFRRGDNHRVRVGVRVRVRVRVRIRARVRVRVRVRIRVRVRPTCSPRRARIELLLQGKG